MGHKRHLFCFILMLHCKTALSGKRSRKSLEKQNGRILCSNRRVTRGDRVSVGRKKVEAGMAEVIQNDLLHRTNFRSHATSAITRSIYDRSVKRRTAATKVFTRLHRPTARNADDCTCKQAFFISIFVARQLNKP